MQVTEVPIGDIKPYYRNAKVHPKKQIQKIADSIATFGFNQPLVVDKENVIIAGHGRYYAAQLLKKEKVPVLTVDLTEEQAKAYRLADNKLNESDWEMKIVIDELKELSIEMIDLTGFSRDLIIEPEAKDDIVPENAPQRAKLGDIWALGRHRVMCADATDKMAVEALMEGKKANMVFTDPPYGIGYLSRQPKKTWGKIKNDELIGENLVDFLSNSLNGYENMYVCCNWKCYTDFEKALGFPKNLIVWDKGSVGLGWGYRYQHEFIMFYGKIEKVGNESDMWEINRDATITYKHPTQKPVALSLRAIKNSSKEGDIVLDLFLGSGSTLIASEKTGRICYGMEIDPRYVDVILKRWEDYTNQKAQIVVK